MGVVPWAGFEPATSRWLRRLGPKTTFFVCEWLLTKLPSLLFWGRIGRLYSRPLCQIELPGVDGKKILSAL